MDCELTPLAMNAALDNELNATELVAFEEHVSQCESCSEKWSELRMLDNALKHNLSPPTRELAVERILNAVALDGKSRRSGTDSDQIQFQKESQFRSIERPVPSRLTSSNRTSANAFLLVVCVLATAIVAISRISAKPAEIGEITLATGPIEMKHEKTQEWKFVNVAYRTSVPAHARIRTGQNSLCEIRTKANAVIRLNEETEMVLHRPEELELVSGQLWCRAPETRGFEVAVETSAQQTSRANALTCPSNSETQWKTSTGPQFSCTCVSTEPIELKVPIELNVEVQKFDYSMNPGESLEIGTENPPTKTAQSDRVLAVGWQLPLLILKNPNDHELQERLTQLLAKIGQSKVSYLYDEQIRNLGPAGTIPLLEYVLSAESLSKPESRLRAMQFIAEMAPASSGVRIKKLLDDPDVSIRGMAEKTLSRLNSERK